MLVCRQPGVFLIVLLNMFVSVPLVIAQPNTDASDQIKRQKALALFNDGKRLDALPLLEDLARVSPADSEILVALAASLVDDAATLTNAEAAGKVRLRARDILQRAWGMGNAGPLAENLRQLLNELPASGALTFSSNPTVNEIMLRGEAAFSRRDFPEALAAYAEALELEPANYTANLFTANTYDRMKEFARAAEWYESAIRLDPNVETAYRYYADMLAKQGEMTKARSMLIHAAVAEPYNKIVWREIRAWATINKTEFNIVYVPVPAQVQGDPAWQAYQAVTADWQKGGRFRKRFPQEAGYRHSLPEESEALSAAARVLEKLKEDEKNAGRIAADPAAGLLLKLHEAGSIDAYVLFSLGDDGIAKDYIAYRAGNRPKLEDYLDKFVMPPAAR